MAIEIQSKTLSLPSIQQHVPVTFHYAIHFTTGVFQPENTLLATVLTSDAESSPKKVLAVVDGGLLQHQQGLLTQLTDYFDRHSTQITLKATPIVVPGGERVKNDGTWIEHIFTAINTVGLCRHSYLLAIGGGAVLDMAGYAAAIAHRGIRLIRIPTTVLAQNDSGVGVKNGVNAFGKKNFLGTFAPPYAVLNDSNFLATLDERDWRSGTAEAIKVALIKDRLFFEWLSDQREAIAQRDCHTMQRLVYRCAQLHLEHIATSGDPFEFGSSRPLDFGHWAAHKLEQLTHYTLRHGEAVAIGIALDSTYSYLTGLLPQLEWQQVLQTLTGVGFTLYDPEMTKQDLFCGLTEFQEHLGGELTLMLLQGIGRGIEVHHVDLERYRQAIHILQNWEGSPYANRYN